MSNLATSLTEKESILTEVQAVHDKVGEVHKDMYRQDAELSKFRAELSQHQDDDKDNFNRIADKIDKKFSELIARQDEQASRLRDSLEKMRRDNDLINSGLKVVGAVAIVIAGYLRIPWTKVIDILRQ